MNTGHGPGSNYDQPVAPKGSFRGAMMLFYGFGGIIYVLDAIFNAIF